MKGTVKSPVTVVVFTILTCGIYGLIWMYGITMDLKNYSGKEDMNPTKEIILSILCFPYYFIWLYNTSKLLDESMEKAGLGKQDNSTLMLILAIAGFGIVSMFIMQENANKIWNS